MNYIRFVSIMALAFVVSFNAWAEDDEDFKVPPRGGMGRVTILTNPPNSDVYLGGEFMGKSPIENKSFKSGRHTLVVTDQGYELVNIRFNVWPDSLNVFNGQTVIPKGSVTITTNPPRCIVYVDGDNADRTDGGPLTIKNLDAGDHVIRVECGRKSKETLVTIKGEQTDSVHLDVNEK